MSMRPSPLLLWLLTAWLALAIAASLWPVLGMTWIALGVALLACATLDAGLLSRAAVSVERSVAPSIAVGVWSPVALEIQPHWRYAFHADVFDHVPAGMSLRGQPRSLHVPPGDAREIEIRYHVLPTERGAHAFGACDVRVTSPLRLLRRRISAGASSHVRVYPNFRAVMRYTLLATDNRTSQLGIKKRPRRGEGLDFHQLREYREGDVLRQIEWRATARMGKLISREYQDERDQQILFLLDCGRKMHTRDGDLSHFDHALNAILLMSHVALRQGDAVGLLSFSGERRWLAPRKGKGHLTALMNTVYDLSTSTRPSDYLIAARDLASRLKKRALVIWVTNLRDEEHRELRAAIDVLSTRHLVLVASMQERALRSALEAPIADFDGALRHAATQRYLSDRKRSHERARAGGVNVLDVEPDRLPVALVNRYLDIKSRRVL